MKDVGRSVVWIVACAGALACGGGGAGGAAKAPQPGLNDAPRPPPGAVARAGRREAAPARDAGAPETLEERAARLHREAIIVDGHDDIPMVLLGNRKDIEDPGPGAHTTLARMKAGGITGEFFSIYVPAKVANKPTVRGGGALRRAIDLIDLTYRQVERHPDALVLATSAADIRRAKRDGKIAVLMGVEGGHAIENSLSALRELYRLGCRYMTLTHSNTNEWADSAGSSSKPAPARHHGLSPFGEDVVREMQRIGMLVDVSHVGDETFWDVMRVAKAPVIASHSSARALVDTHRNMTDDMLRALAKNGGVVMINFWSMFVSRDYQAHAKRWRAAHARELAALEARSGGDPSAFRAGLDELKKKDPLPKVPLSALVDHIDHAVKVAGIEHVGLGSDFDGVDALPEGIDGIDDLPKITLELVRRGYSDEDVLAILGGNFLRVFERAEAYARSTKTTLSGDGDLTRIDDKRAAPTTP